MDLCERCQKVVRYSSPYVRLSVIEVSGNDMHDHCSKVFHRKCFNKLFIYRVENNDCKCPCGIFASFGYDGMFVSITLYNTYEQYIHYFHFDHFIKYWMGSLCDGDNMR